jgi:hypothetical protein
MHGPVGLSIGRGTRPKGMGREDSFTSLYPTVLSVWRRGSTATRRSRSRSHSSLRHCAPRSVAPQRETLREVDASPPPDADGSGDRVSRPRKSMPAEQKSEPKRRLGEIVQFRVRLR